MWADSFRVHIQMLRLLTPEDPAGGVAWGRGAGQKAWEVHFTLLHWLNGKVGCRRMYSHTVYIIYQKSSELTVNTTTKTEFLCRCETADPTLNGFHASLYSQQGWLIRFNPNSKLPVMGLGSIEREGNVGCQENFYGETYGEAAAHPILNLLSPNCIGSGAFLTLNPTEWGKSRLRLREFLGWRYSSAVQHSPSMHKALGSNTSNMLRGTGIRGEVSHCHQQPSQASSLGLPFLTETEHWFLESRPAAPKPTHWSPFTSASSPGIFSHSLLKSKLRQYTNQMVLPTKQQQRGKEKTNQWYPG